jgi:uncharacterized protein YkwD
MKNAFSPIVVLVALAILPGAQGVNAQKKRTARPVPQKSKTVKPTPAPLAKTTSTSSSREREILAEINLARANPTQYAGYLEAFKPNYSGKELRFSDGQSLVTNEGVSACDEAIAYLRTLKPLAPLEMRTGLALSAKDHVGDLVKTGGHGHKGSDGSVPEDRVSRYGTWTESVGENILYKSGKAREDVISLIIDDGVATRGHRKNIFKSNFHVAGIAFSSGKSGTIGVITFAGGFADIPTPRDSKSAAPTAARF